MAIRRISSSKRYASSSTGLCDRAADGLVGECSELISELTGMERVTFCNTGSEAVMGAMRLARTVADATWS